MSISFKIAITNWIIVIIIFLMFVSPLGQKPGAMHPLLIIPFFYLLLSFIPTLIGVIVGIIEKYKAAEKSKINIGIFLNVGYLIIFFSLIAFMWEYWMSI